MAQPPLIAVKGLPCGKPESKSNTGGNSRCHEREQDRSRSQAWDESEWGAGVGRQAHILLSPDLSSPLGEMVFERETENSLVFPQQAP